jgi:hypothetical protein
MLKKNMKNIYSMRKGLAGDTRIPSFLPLGATAQGELWHPEQSASIFLYSEVDSGF